MFSLLLKELIFDLYGTSHLVHITVHCTDLHVCNCLHVLAFMCVTMYMVMVITRNNIHGTGHLVHITVHCTDLHVCNCLHDTGLHVRNNIHGNGHHMRNNIHGTSHLVHITVHCTGLHVCNCLHVLAFMCVTMYMVMVITRVITYMVLVIWCMSLYTVF